MQLERNQNRPPVESVRESYSCYMSSVPHGGALRYDFDPDPIRMIWGLSAQINTMPTRGGQVSYAVNRLIGPLVITGFLRTRWDLLELGDFVAQHMKEGMLEGHPLNIVYPERDIDYSVYIQDFSEIGLDSEQGEIVAYTLTCAVTQDHSALPDPLTDLSYLGKELPANVGWIDVANAAEIAERRFPQIGGGIPDETGDEDTKPGDEGDNPEEADVKKGGKDGRTEVSEDPRQRLPGPGDVGDTRPKPSNPNLGMTGP